MRRKCAQEGSKESGQAKNATTRPANLDKYFGLCCVLEPCLCLATDSFRAACCLCLSCYLALCLCLDCSTVANCCLLELFPTAPPLAVTSVVIYTLVDSCR